MFSVECEKCHNAIPLGMTECPVCAAKEAVADTQDGMQRVTAAAPAAASAAAQQAPRYAGPAPVAPPPPPPHSLPPTQTMYTVPQPKPALPPWLVAVGVAVLLGLVLALGYLVLVPKMRSGAHTAAGASSEVKLETPAHQQAAPAAKASRFGKYIEVVGVRVIEENKKATVKFLVVNHASAELSDVNGTVEIHPVNGTSMVGRVDVKIPSLGPNESREFSAPLNTTLRAYEIPDWQFLRAQFVE